MIGGHEFDSRFILGSGKYSMDLIESAIRDAGAQIITLAVRRTNTKKEESILDHIPEDITLLPNTSGARNADEAVRIARLARELGCGDFVKIEIMRDSKYLLPDNKETVKALMLNPHVENMNSPQMLHSWRSNTNKHFSVPFIISAFFIIICHY